MASAPLDANAGTPNLICPVWGCSGPPDPPPNNCDCPPCDSCGTTSADDCTDTSSSSYSGHPIRYSNGEIRLVMQDLGSNGFGLPWGHTRSYSNRVTNPATGFNGSSWFVK